VQQALRVLSVPPVQQVQLDHKVRQGLREVQDQAEELQDQQVLLVQRVLQAQQEQLVQQDRKVMSAPQAQQVPPVRPEVQDLQEQLVQPALQEFLKLALLQFLTLH
jgi:hypothetical protein